MTDNRSTWGKRTKPPRKRDLTPLTLEQIRELTQPEIEMLPEDAEEFVECLEQEKERMQSEGKDPYFYWVRWQCRNCWALETGVTPYDIEEEELLSGSECETCGEGMRELEKDMTRF